MATCYAYWLCILTVALLTKQAEEALLTMAILTMAILTMALLTKQAAEASAIARQKRRAATPTRTPSPNPYCYP